MHCLYRIRILASSSILDNCHDNKHQCCWLQFSQYTQKIPYLGPHKVQKKAQHSRSIYHLTVYSDRTITRQLANNHLMVCNGPCSCRGRLVFASQLDLSCYCSSRTNNPLPTMLELVELDKAHLLQVQELKIS